jgi:hypothetical protein
MTITNRERILIAMNNGKPDRLPCLIHAWVEYHLKTTLHTLDQIFHGSIEHLRAFADGAGKAPIDFRSNRLSLLRQITCTMPGGLSNALEK